MRSKVVYWGSFILIAVILATMADFTIQYAIQQSIGWETAVLQNVASMICLISQLLFWPVMGEDRRLVVLPPWVHGGFLAIAVMLQGLAISYANSLFMGAWLTLIAGITLVYAFARMIYDFTSPVTARALAR